MKKRWLSVIAFALLICMLLPMAFACGKRDNTDTSTGTSDTTTDTSTGTGTDSNTNTNTNTGTGTNTDTNTDSGTGEEDDEPTGGASVLESQSAPVVKYLRIAEIGENSVTVKFNLVGEANRFEIRTSDKEITDKNYEKATVVDCEVTGDGVIKTVVIPNIVADRDNATFISVKASNDSYESNYDTVRAGGIYLVELDPTHPQQIGNGETNRSLIELIDEQTIVGDPYREEYDYLPESRPGRFWDEQGTVYFNHTTTATHERFGTQLAPIIDLFYVHYIDNVMVYYPDITYDVIVRVSKDAANFNTPEDWDEEYILKRYVDQVANDLEYYVTVLVNDGRETNNSTADVIKKEYDHFRQGLGTQWLEIQQNGKLSDEEKKAQQNAIVAAEIAAQRQYFAALVAALKDNTSTAEIGNILDTMYQNTVRKTTGPVEMTVTIDSTTVTFSYAHPKTGAQVDEKYDYTIVNDKVVVTKAGNPVDETTVAFTQTEGALTSVVYNGRYFDLVFNGSSDEDEAGIDGTYKAADPLYIPASKLLEDLVTLLEEIRENAMSDDSYRSTFTAELAAAISTADKACGLAYDAVPYTPTNLLKEISDGFEYQMIEPYYFNRIDIDKEVRYVQIEFKDGEAPSEVLVYGYSLCEDEEMLIQDTVHQLPTVGEMMGQCGFVAGGGGNCTIEQLACSYVIREYHNVGWSYSIGSFPGKAVNLVNTVVGNFDSAYKAYSEAGFLVVPCLQWNEASAPARIYDDFEGKLSTTVASWEEKYLPENYAAYADLIYQYAARYGSSKMGYLVENMIAHSDATPGATAGRGQIQWIELGNEPNGEDAAGATPYQLAALTSAAYDGHQRTLLSHVYNPNSFSYPFGGKNADPDIKLAIAGLAGIQDRYIMSMAYWMRANRTDGSIAMDAFNVHTYFGKYFTMNDQTIIVGVSPEEYGLVDAMSRLVEFRNKYYPDVEVWLTEFGWDTNQSYETMTSAHAYDTKDLNGDGIISEYEMVMRGREIQGMWLVRAYILLSSCGVDKATMYMCEDASSDEVGAIGKYGTCGIWAEARMPETRYQIFDAKITEVVDKETVVVAEAEVYKVVTVELNEKGEEVEVTKYYRTDNHEPFANNLDTTKQKLTTESKMEAKDGYYYMYTLQNALGDMRFVKEIASGNDDVWVYEFADGKGKVGYAVWCPTSNGTVVENYQLVINGSEATLIETDSKNADIDGVHTNLEITNNTVSITVSENPVYVIVK